MKRLKSILSSLIFTLCTADSLAQMTFEETVVDLSGVHIPEVSGAAPHTTIFVSGIFPNGCYQWKGAEVHHASEFEHEVIAVAQVAQAFCTMALEPFTEKVELGHMRPGTHVLRFLNSDQTYFEETLFVE